MKHHPGLGTESQHRTAACARFWAALLLRQLSHGHSVGTVSARSGVPVGVLQALQAAAATHAGQLKAFCYEAGHHSFANVIAGWQARVEGVDDLVSLESLLRLRGVREPYARLLIRAGFVTIDRVAAAPLGELLHALRQGQASAGAGRGVMADSILAGAARKMQRHATQLVAMDGGAVAGGDAIVAAGQRRSTLPPSLCFGREHALSSRAGADAGGGRRRSLPLDLIHVGSQHGVWEAFLSEWERAPVFSWAARTSADGQLHGLAICWNLDTVYWIPLAELAGAEARAEGAQEASARIAEMAAGAGRAAYAAAEGDAETTALFAIGVRRVFARGAKKIAHGAAPLLRALHAADVRVAPPLIDTRIAGELLAPGVRSPPDLTAMVGAWLGASSPLATIGPACTGHELACVRAAQTLGLMQKLALPLLDRRLDRPCKRLCALTTTALATVGSGVLPICVDGVRSAMAVTAAALRVLDSRAAAALAARPEAARALLGAASAGRSQPLGSDCSLTCGGDTPGASDLPVGNAGDGVPMGLACIGPEELGVLFRGWGGLGEAEAAAAARSVGASDGLLVRFSWRFSLAALLLEHRWLTARLGLLRRVLARVADARALGPSGQPPVAVGGRSTDEALLATGRSRGSGALASLLPLALEPDTSRGGLWPADTLLRQFLEVMGAPSVGQVQWACEGLRLSCASRAADTVPQHTASELQPSAAGAEAHALPLAEAHTSPSAGPHSLPHKLTCASAPSGLPPQPDAKTAANNPASGRPPDAAACLPREARLSDCVRLPAGLVLVLVGVSDLELTMLAHHSGDPHLAAAAALAADTVSVADPGDASAAAASHHSPAVPPSLSSGGAPYFSGMMSRTAARLLDRPLAQLSSRDVHAVRHLWAGLHRGYLDAPSLAADCEDSGGAMEEGGVVCSRCRAWSGDGQYSEDQSSRAQPVHPAFAPASEYGSAKAPELDPVSPRLAAAFPLVASFHRHLCGTTGAVTTIGGREVCTDALRSGRPHERERAAARLLGQLCDGSARDILASLLHRLSPVLARVVAGSDCAPAGTATTKWHVPEGKTAGGTLLLMLTASALYFAVPSQAAKHVEHALTSAAVTALEAVAAEFAITLPLHSVVRIGAGRAFSSLDETDIAMGETSIQSIM